MFDVWGRKLVMRQTGGNAGTLWLSVRRWLERHPEAGKLVESPYPTTMEAIIGWIRERKTLFNDLDEDQRKAFERAVREPFAGNDGFGAV
jgi:hypothetical protein